MIRNRPQSTFPILLSALLLAGATLIGANVPSTMHVGKANVQSAGVMTFGPEAILFVGDSAGAKIWALDTGDDTLSDLDNDFEVSGIDKKIAAALGTTPDQILINDLAVNPVSRKAYISVSRGLGPAAQPVILRMESGGAIEELALDQIRHSRIELPNAPGPEDKDRRGRSQRREAITDLVYADGQLFIAGLSNEEFSSKLRNISFPFTEADSGTSVEIFHGSHGRYETNSPVRTMVYYELAQEPHLLAAYTCTPLVKFPVSRLETGAKIRGTTVAELGNRNRPLDMIVYEKSGSDFILMNNSSRGLMKMATGPITDLQGIVERTEVAGLSYETLDHLKGVQELDLLSPTRALALFQSEAGSFDLRSIVLP